MCEVITFSLCSVTPVLPIIRCLVTEVIGCLVRLVFVILGKMKKKRVFVSFLVVGVSVGVGLLAIICSCLLRIG